MGTTQRAAANGSALGNCRTAYRLEQRRETTVSLLVGQGLQPAHSRCARWLAHPAACNCKRDRANELSTGRDSVAR